MKFETINSSKIIWTIYPANEWDDSTAEYCADGDGLVTVKAKKCGCFVLFNEIEYLASFKTLAEALEAGQNWLANDYPEIFAKACI